MLSYNINEYVYVKLVDRGKTIWKEHYEKHKLVSTDFPFESLYNSYTNFDGYTRFQFYDLCHIFGTQLTVGSEAPFGTSILFETEYLKEVEVHFKTSTS